MFDKINKFCSSSPMLWTSGICLLVSFFGEYIIPLISGEQKSFLVYFAWGAIIISGVPLAHLAISRVIKQRFISSALLITIAMLAAIAIGDIFAAGEVAFIMAIGEVLENKTVEKAKKGIGKLLSLVPSVARVINDDVETMLDTKELKINNIVRVIPGEAFSCDGVIVRGATTVNQSILSGESLPVDKVIGDEVFMGTINCFGSVDVEVSKTYSDSTLQKMIKLVEDAENKKAPMQRIVDKWATWLVPIAVMIAVVSYLVVAFAFNNPDEALLRAVTVLVVFCPCALALATPTSVMAAIGQATNKGVLIKSAQALEEMGRVSTIAFDKTGTITKGELEVSDIYNYNVTKNELISICASVEGYSEHPIGKAVLKYAKDNGIALQKVEDFKMQVGKGVSGKIGEMLVKCGNEKLVEIDVDDEIKSNIDKSRDEGKAVIIVSRNASIIGILACSDTIKANSQSSIAKLGSLGIENTVLLTGDNDKSANSIANKVGITKVYSSLLPEDKLNVVSLLMSDGQGVCMIGDGVNDAPALKAATVGIAMGTMGSDIAIEASDIAIMSDDISKISYIKKLSNATIFSIKFNITLSMCINFVAITLSVLGLLTPTTGALVHNAGSVLVVLNAARLYDKKIEN